MSRFVVAFCSMLAAYSLPLLCQTTTKGQVGFRIVSPTGVVATDAAIELSNQETGERFKASQGRLTDGEAQRRVPATGLLLFKNIPFGRYDVRAKAFPLWQGKQKIEIEVTRLEQWFTICLAVDLPIKKWQPTQEPISQEPVLRGRISTAKLTGQVWIKIIGVFHNASVETVADAKGAFAVSGLRKGKYVAILTPTSGSVHVVQFEFNSDEEIVDLRLP